MTLVPLIVTVASPSPWNNKERALGTVASAMMVLVLLTVPPLIVTVALPEAAPADAIMEPELPMRGSTERHGRGGIRPSLPNASTAPALAISAVDVERASAHGFGESAGTELRAAADDQRAAGGGFELVVRAKNVTALSVKAPPRAATSEFDTMAALTIVAEPPG